MGRKIQNDDGEMFTGLLALELRGQLASHSMTIRDAAKLLGHSRPTLSNWLNNKVPIPVSVAFRLCELVGTPLSEVVDRAYARYLKEANMIEEVRLAARNLSPRFTPPH